MKSIISLKVENMIKKIKATASVLTYNNQDTLKRCLDSIKEFDEIIISDGGSTDSTLKIAQAYNCKIIKQSAKGKITDFAKERNRLIKLAKHDWLFFIDSDESASKELIREVRKIVHHNKPGGVQFQFKVFFNQRIIKWYASYPGWRICLFHKQTKAKFVKPVHEKLRFKPEYKILSINAPFYRHWNDEYVNNYWQDMDYYLKLEEKNAKKFTDSDYWKSVLFYLKVITGRVIRVIYFRLFKPKTECMPIIVECNKIIYYLKVLFRISLIQVKKL